MTFKNRELEMMRMMQHPNVCALKAYFYNQGEKVKLNKNILCYD